MRERAPIFLFLLFGSMEHTRKKEKKKVYILNPFCVYYELQYQEAHGSLETADNAGCERAVLYQRKHPKARFSKGKNCRQRALWAINIKTGAALIAAKGTKVKPSPCSSAGLLYLWIPCLPLPPLSLPPSHFRGVRQETQCQQKTFHRALVS